MDDASQSYLIALGSNRRHRRYGDPRGVLKAAVARLGALGEVVATARTIATAPLGPSRRRFANTAALLACDLMPPQLLAALKAIERNFGRRRGRRWGERTLDLDIILWSGGMWSSSDLDIPHPAFRTRRFVLAPAEQIAPYWRDAVTGFTLRQLDTKNKRSKPLDPLPHPF